jgi:septal ring factor EnvC (AmiA/AmiB activator)
MVFAAAGALAAPADVKREELKGLQGRIQALQKDIARTEESRADVAEELRETEQAISEANRKLRELGGERAEVQATLSSLNTQSRQLSERIAIQQAQLGRLFTRQYHAGESDALRHLLSGNDPNQLARDAHFLGLLSRAKAGLIRNLGEKLDEKRRLAGLAEAKHGELAEIERRQERERAGLVDQQKKRQAVLARLSDRLKAQRQEVGKLKRDEKRLAKLIEGLGRIAAKPKRVPQTQAPAQRNPRTPQASPTSGAFAQLKGRLPLPTRGELASRFGTPRQEGGTTWKGVFIRAAGGSEVKAVAAGRVVFADWLRGFGNLAIVDHDDGFLSVYGNNESLFRTVGDAVKTGEVIAAVGNSGGNPETGLYFELRHLGQPLDPMKWVHPQ